MNHVTGEAMTASDTNRVRQSVVLLIAESPAASRELGEAIEALGCMCHAVHDLAQAENILTHYAPDCVVMNYATPDGHGAELIGLLRRRMMHKRTPIVLITGEITEVELERAVMHGIYAYLAKPFRVEELQRLVGAAIADYQTARLRKP
ncbi:MAG: response regulator [Planctomycetaceae bacterium]|nr:response regulator [Planctomycetaceae bacterium]